MSDLDTALALAIRVHAGQRDRAGKPYILHPLRIMQRFQTEPEQIVAVLHDVVEDGDVTLDRIRELGFSEAVVAGIDGMTKRPGESYEAFVERLAPNPLARAVKIMDIRDNIDVTRLPSMDERDLQRVAKYHRALKFLEGIEKAAKDA